MRLLTCVTLALTLTLSAGFGQDPKKDDKKPQDKKKVDDKKKIDDRKVDDKKPEVRKGEPITKDWLAGKWKHPTDGRVSLTLGKDGKGSLSTVTPYMGVPTPSTVRFDYKIDENNFVTMTQGQAHIGTAEKTKDGKLRVTAPHDGIRSVDFDRAKDDEKPKDDKKPRDDKKELKKPKDDRKKDDTKPRDEKKDDKKPIKD